MCIGQYGCYNRFVNGGICYVRMYFQCCISYNIYRLSIYVQSIVLQIVSLISYVKKMLSHLGNGSFIPILEKDLVS